MPSKALKRYSTALEHLGVAISNRRNESSLHVLPPDLEKLQNEYNSLRKKYIKAYDDLLDSEHHPKLDLSKPEHTKIIVDAILFWESKKYKIRLAR